MKNVLKKIAYGLAFAIPLMLLSYALAYAANGTVQDLEEKSEGTPACATCHPALVESWQSGHHGQATTDPEFKNSWEAQGRPADCLNCHVTGYDEVSGNWESDGITCQACHPVTENHPGEAVAVDLSPDVCGKCHVETFFEWQVSMHGQKGLRCANCHDAHSTQLKKETSATLCGACHQGLAASFTHSQHDAQGLVCIDCHMEPISAEGGHNRKDHSFFVSLSTCNRCHSNQLHDPGLVSLEQTQVNPVDAMASVEDVQVSGVPKPVNPTAFAILAGLVGIAIGINLAPYLERWGLHRKAGK